MRMIQFKDPWGHGEVRADVEVARYASGGLALRLWEGGEPYSTCSINLEEYGLTPETGCVWIKAYAEGEPMPAILAETGVITLTGRQAEVGPYGALCVEGRINPEYLA